MSSLNPTSQIGGMAVAILTAFTLLAAVIGSLILGILLVHFLLGIALAAIVLFAIEATGGGNPVVDVFAILIAFFAGYWAQNGFALTALSTYGIPPLILSPALNINISDATTSFILDAVFIIVLFLIVLFGLVSSRKRRTQILGMI